MATATVEVAAAPPPVTYSIDPQSASVSEGAGTVTFTVSRSDSTAAQTLYVSTVQNQGSTNNSDYVGKLNEPLNFAVGQAQQSVTVTITNDTIVEGNETFGLIVKQLPTDPVDAFLASASFTILDDDGGGGETIFFLTILMMANRMAMDVEQSASTIVTILSVNSTLVPAQLEKQT